MKTITTITFCFLALLFLSSNLYAQEQPNSGPIGLSASVQNGQTNLQIPIWISNNVSVAPIFGLNHQEDEFTSLNLGIAPRFYQDIGNDFASYIGARGILQRTSPDVGPEDSDFLLGATGGGEYFLSEHFNAGVEAQLNFLINDNGNDRIGTGAAVMATYYF